MLIFSDVYQLFSEHRGIEDDALEFEIVSSMDEGNLKKGLFVPLQDDARLDRAIESGAIATLWPKEKEIPFFAPNHFPIFKVDDPLDALKKICENYIFKIEKEECEKMTKFVLFSPELLNNHPYTYDFSDKSAGQQLLKTINQVMDTKGRG